jgi:hypothetical protein
MDESETRLITRKAVLLLVNLCVEILGKHNSEMS